MHLVCSEKTIKLAKVGFLVETFLPLVEERKCLHLQGSQMLRLRIADIQFPAVDRPLYQVVLESRT